jgi:hypothetical protein
MRQMKRLIMMHFFDIMARWDYGDGVSPYPKTHIGILHQKGQVFLHFSFSLLYLFNNSQKMIVQLYISRFSPSPKK